MPAEAGPTGGLSLVALANMGPTPTKSAPSAMACWASAKPEVLRPICTSRPRIFRAAQVGRSSRPKWTSTPSAAATPTRSLTTSRVEDGNLDRTASAWRNSSPSEHDFPEFAPCPLPLQPGRRQSEPNLLLDTNHGSATRTVEAEPRALERPNASEGHDPCRTNHVEWPECLPKMLLDKII